MSSPKTAAALQQLLATLASWHTNPPPGPPDVPDFGPGSWPSDHLKASSTSTRQPRGIEDRRVFRSSLGPLMGMWQLGHDFKVAMRGLVIHGGDIYPRMFAPIQEPGLYSYEPHTHMQDSKPRGTCPSLHMLCPSRLAGALERRAFENGRTSAIGALPVVDPIACLVATGGVILCCALGHAGAARPTGHHAAL